MTAPQDQKYMGVPTYKPETGSAMKSSAASSAGHCASAAGRHRSTRPPEDGEQEAEETTRKGNQRTEGQRDAIPTVPTTCRLALAQKNKSKTNRKRKGYGKWSEAPHRGTPKNLT